MASIAVASGATVAITTSTTPPATFNAAGYGALSYTDLGCLSSIGEFGDVSSEVTFDCIGTGRTLKLKGQRDAGNMELTVALDDTTGGFDALHAAQENDSTGDFYFKVTLPNKQNATGTDAIRYFGGKVMQVKEVLGGANDVMTLQVTVGINTAIVRVDSTAGV